MLALDGCVSSDAGTATRHGSPGGGIGGPAMGLGNWLEPVELDRVKEAQFPRQNARCKIARREPRTPARDPEVRWPMPDTDQGPLCFVLMPFGKKPDSGGAMIDFDAVYGQVIRPSIRAAGMVPIRADEEQTGGIIHRA